MITNEIIIRGGLGNQIFGIFYAYKLYLKYKKKVSLNLTSYSTTRRKDRTFIIDKIYPPIFNKFENSSTIFSKLIYFLGVFIEKFFVLQKSNRIRGDNPFFIKYWNNRYLYVGYFQRINNTKLDKKSLELLKNDFLPYISDVKKNFLAIHIRRGDYLSINHNIHGIIDTKFLFEEAKKQISINKYDGITIFTDSPDLVDFKMFKYLHKNVFLDKGGDPQIVFKRMANHKGLIASNSSFSLWAGILGDIEYFSIPQYWMRNVKSSCLGLSKISRYKCTLE